MVPQWVAWGPVREHCVRRGWLASAGKDQLERGLAETNYLEARLQAQVIKTRK